MSDKVNLCSDGFVEELLVAIDRSDIAIQERARLREMVAKLIDDYKRTREFDFREIGDHLYDGLYISDGAGKTLYVNRAYCRISGLKPEEVLDRLVSDCERDGLYKNAVTPEVIRQKKTVNSMGMALRTGIPMLVTGVPILDEKGDVKKVVVIDREMTDLLAIQAELEESQQKMKSVQEATKKSRQEIEHLRKQQLNENFIGQSEEVKRISRMISQVAGLDVTVLITGETGTGKEVVANEIYRKSSRQNGPFIKVNCAAIPANLLEAELFGYEKGAFTGASGSGKIGMFELADKGTLLLDEIGELPTELQAKLLRVIQHKEITKLGGRRPVKLDVRIIAATNCELRDLVRQGKFREDLYYRLHVFPIPLSPLRGRVEDIPMLSAHFLDVYNAKYVKSVSIEHNGFEMLKQYAWPGNVRELQNVIERLVIISEQGVVGTEQIGNLLNIDPFYTELVNSEMGLREIVENVERKTIEKVLARCGSTRKAAGILKIDQSTVVKKARRLGISLVVSNGDDKTHLS